MEDFNKMHHLIIRVEEEKLNRIFKKLHDAEEAIYEAYGELKEIGIAEIIPAAESNRDNKES